MQKLNQKKKHKVMIKPLDEFINIKKCSFLKIDVELMELSVLMGAKKFLKKNLDQLSGSKSSGIS